MSDAITIRKMPDDRYADIIAAAKFHAPKYGGKTNAFANMVRESKLYQQWRRRNVPKPPKERKAKGGSSKPPADSTTAP